MYDKKAVGKYREKNKEAILEYQREYYLKNKEKRLAYKKEWYEKRKDELKEGKSNFHINFKMETEKFNRLRDKLSEEGITAADLVRQAIEEYLQK